ncbi:MAG: hypothetical protein WCP29_09995 [Acidobacteriota bacterium]
MATSVTNGKGSPLLVVSGGSGITVIDPSTPLRRLNYFDGRFLRADDLDVEQQYLRRLVALSNQGLGSGVVYGYDTSLAGGDAVQIGPGLAVDPSGRVLLLQTAVTHSIQALIDASRTQPAAAPDVSGKTGTGAFTDCVEIVAPPSRVVLQTSDLYVIAICAAEALCGQADVYGKLCEEACVTSTDRPYRLDGIVLRAIPLQLVTSSPASKMVNIDANLYWRSKVAHSWFGDETRKHPDAISRAGLLSEVWCLGAGYSSSCCEVPLAVVARAGATTLFLDAWIVRRERMDAPARRYWQWTMRMRPWDVFLAQVLQFQCQLADLLSGIVTPGDRAANPCEPQHEAITEAVDFVERVRAGLAGYRNLPVDAAPGGQPALLSLSLSHISDLRDKLHVVLNAGRTLVRTKDRILIRGGIIELPPAGYLPVLTGTSVTVNEQVRALLGDGLDLRFCITTTDDVAHAVEQAQHMDRISLLQGLDDPSNKPHVDILVPEGTATAAAAVSAGVYDASLSFSTRQTGGLLYRGAAREETLASGGTALYLAATGLSQSVIAKFNAMAKEAASAKPVQPLAVTPDIATNTFVTAPKATAAKFDSLVGNAGTVARKFTLATGVSLGRKAETATELRAISTYGSVDGLWLTARADQDLRTLGVGQQTPVGLRVVLGMHPASPEAFEVSFHGTLAVAQASATVLTGTLSGIYAFGILREDQGQQKTTEFLITERGHWPATITYAGDETDGSITLDVSMPVVAGATVRFSKTYIGGNARVLYELAVVPTAGGAAGTPVTMGRLRLVADSQVVQPANVHHQYAETGLDIVQAALIVSEPTIKATADAQLFPPLPPATAEVAIQAVRDWVMFTRRRETQCAVVAAPVEVLPPRRYRILNVLAKNKEDAARQVEQLTALAQDPPSFARTLVSLMARDEHALVVNFPGGSATTDTDPSAIESDWRTFFRPGESIVYAAVGAQGETDAALQLNRLHTFESAIAADSTETPTAKEVSILPYPDAAVPLGADGIMLFITVTLDVAVRQHVYLANADGLKLVTTALEGGPNAPPLATMLGRIDDVGTASYTVSAAGAVTVDEAAVLGTIAALAPQPAIRAVSFVVTPQGASAADAAHALDAGVQIVKASTPGAQTTKTFVYAGTWPVAESSILVIQESPR